MLFKFSPVCCRTDDRLVILKLTYATIRSLVMYHHRKYESRTFHYDVAFVLFYKSSLLRAIKLRVFFTVICNKTVALTVELNMATDILQQD